MKVIFNWNFLWLEINRTCSWMSFLYLPICQQMMDSYITILIKINEVVAGLLMGQMNRFRWNDSYRNYYHQSLNSKWKSFVKIRVFQWVFFSDVESNVLKENKPDERRPIECVDVSLDFARSNTLTSNFINILSFLLCILI